MTPQNRALAFEYAKTQLPREACGLVVIERGREIFIPCRNIAELESDFAIHPEDYLKAEARGQIVRVFHSHCYQSPRPSEGDLVSCETTKLPWSIVSVPNGDWFDFDPKGYRAPLVGRQWTHGILDCYSIIRDYYAEVLSIDIPDFERPVTWWKRGLNLYEENFSKAGFYQVKPEELRKHDVLLMIVGSPVINHGAVYLGDDMMLHHLINRLSTRDLFAGYWRKHCVKILRHHQCEQ